MNGVEFMPETDAATFWLLIVFILISISLESDPDADDIDPSPVFCPVSLDPLFFPDVVVPVGGRGGINAKLGHRSLGSMVAFLSFNDVRFIFACR